MTQPKLPNSAAATKTKPETLVFENVKIDPLSNPELFGVRKQDIADTSSVNLNDGWDSDEKKEEPAPSSHHHTEIKEETDDKNDENVVNGDEYNFTKIEANIQRARKKKKVDFRAELTSDSNDIDDLLLFQSKEKNEEQEELRSIDEQLLDVDDTDIMNVEQHEMQEKKNKQKSIQKLLQETDEMFKEIQIKKDEINSSSNKGFQNVNASTKMNVDDSFDFDSYINQQDADEL
eukprot:CAMPEP_0202727892 /NCGR_PEP_ID=MMETSP1385-20130828/185348_1 /ASSEMBLY_ACC=CAM_ASM_000861 /TAXON_ID=933848 /ORGANISM="Elphidium margaritaceum" /LENGTH=232 /DNA_ID=CAMNT_0049394135 /DNA_START=1919 /DNA_END=2617 /DNA_ORIENTATION=+